MYVNTSKADSLHIQKQSNDSNKLGLSEPDGADKVIDAGSLGATSYLDFIKSYFLSLTGLTMGGIIVINYLESFIIIL